MKYNILILMIVGLMLTSCSFSPEMEKNAEIAKPMKEFSTSGTDKVSKYWWTTFDDNKLNYIINIGLKKNLDITIAWDRLEQAQAIAKKAGAMYSPTLTASTGYSFTSPSQSPTTPGTEPDDYDSRFSLGFSTSYEIDLWGRISAGKKAAGYSFQASALDVQTTAITISSSIATNWYQLVQQYSKLKLLESQNELNEKFLQITKNNYNQGQALISDVYQQQQQISTKQNEITLTKMQIELIENSLALLLAETPDYQINVQVDKFPDLPPLPDTGIPAELLNRRPDIMAAYFRVASANERVGEAIANRYPKLSISATYSGNGDSFETLFSNWILNLASNLTQPLFDGGKLESEVDRTEAATLEKLHTYEKLVLSAYKEVEDALATEMRYLEYQKKLRTQHELAQKSLSVLRKKYQNGTIDYLKVLNQLQSLQSIEIHLLEVRYTLISNRIKLYKSLAGSIKISK
ncbi:MAG: TolC family protein [Planctomycetes bacterium]|nr:TolC family protein [Planctomycetota bacterium]